eukprot:3147717-Prymnesium_polylepis.1
MRRPDPAAALWRVARLTRARILPLVPRVVWWLLSLRCLQDVSRRPRCAVPTPPPRFGASPV